MSVCAAGGEVDVEEEIGEGRLQDWDRDLVCTRGSPITRASPVTPREVCSGTSQTWRRRRIKGGGGGSPQNFFYVDFPLGDSLHRLQLFFPAFLQLFSNTLGDSLHRLQLFFSTFFLLSKIIIYILISLEH